MKNARLRTLVAIVSLCAVAFIAPHRCLYAQQQASVEAIHTYAITGARIVTLAGPTIERGTVVIRNGLIQAVGASVTPPADARIIDGTGLTVYPGLIDANTSLAIPAPTPQPTPRGGQGLLAFFAQPSTPAFSSPNSPYPPGLQPEILAADLVRPGGEQIEAARSAGITAALTVPREGIFIGQSALINLAGETPQQMVVRSPIALHVGFTPLRGGTYPSSLMGVFAAIRQMLLDAQRYDEALQTYERDPRGLRRPEPDKSLAALVPVVKGQLPVVMYADTEREIRRALDLAQEFNLKAIIAGGTEAWKVADRLRQQRVPVLVSLNFPRRTTAPNPEADPEPLRVLRARVEAPRNPARLAAAGVQFAFQSGGLTNMNDFLNNAARAVENGLSRDEAVRAMTIRAAEILGVADRLGSIEAGKIANLTVTRGDLLDRNRRIAYVFIDGRPVELRPETAAGPPSTGASGAWTLRLISTEGREYDLTLNLQQQGERLTGTLQGALGTADIANGSISAAGEFRFTARLQYEGQTTEATFTGNITGNEMRGTVQIVGRSPASFTGTRASAPPPSRTGTPPSGSAATDLSGTWNLTFDLGDQALPATLTLRQQGERFTGTLQSALGSSEISDGAVGADGFRFTTTVTFGGETFTITANGTVQGNQMNGTVSSPRGTVTFTGTRPQGGER